MIISPRLKIQIDTKITEISSVAHLLPGVVIIHRLPDFKVEYMSPIGLQQLDVSLQQVCSMSAAEYFERYFNPEDAGAYIPKMKQYIEQNTDDSIPYFQQVRLAASPDWVWHLSVTKILLRNEANMPVLTITAAHPVESMRHVNLKVQRLHEENNFLRKNYHRFSKLGPRECDVLRLQVLGKSSQEIAEELFIAVATVETHRRNIKKKLHVNTSYELSQYARAFDLI